MTVPWLTESSLIIPCNNVKFMLLQGMISDFQSIKLM